MWDKLTIFSINNSHWTQAWMKRFCNSTDLAEAGLYKIRGTGVYQLLWMFLLMPFSDLKIYQFKHTDLPVPGRDAFYRFLGKAKYNWAKLLMRVSTRQINELNTLTDSSNPRVLIVDSSSYKRDRSKRVEYLGWQYDYNEARHYRGFRLLAAGWSDGHSFVPMGFELLTNQDDDKRLGPDPEVDRRTHGGRRCRQALGKSTDLTEDLVRQADNQNIDFDYLAIDSGFAYPGLLYRLHNITPVICRLKNDAKITYRHGDHIYDLTGLYQLVRRRSRRKKSSTSIIGSIVVGMLSGPKMRIVFVRDRKNPDQWIALASTDTEETPTDICRIYAMRWDIEVFFKMIKQHLSLYQMQPRGYTSMIGYISIVFMRYMMFSYYHRNQIDQMTLPGMFRMCAKQLQQASLGYCLMLLQSELIQSVRHNPMKPVIECVDLLVAHLHGFTEMICSNLLSTKT